MDDMQVYIYIVDVCKWGLYRPTESKTWEFPPMFGFSMKCTILGYLHLWNRNMYKGLCFPSSDIGKKIKNMKA